jgi:hypothetical protein
MVERTVMTPNLPSTKPRILAHGENVRHGENQIVTTLRRNG